MPDMHPGDGGPFKDYWTHGEGAGKIRWGEPGDFMRCVHHLEKHVSDPKGLCNVYHRAALGVAPGQEHAASMVPGIGQAAQTGMQLANRTIGYMGQLSAIGAEGLETGGSEPGQVVMAANLVTVPGVELMRTGTWQVSTGEWTVTPELIHAAIDAHQSGVLRKPVIRLGHNDPRFSGDPAVGYVDNLRASPDGQTLVGDLVGLPQWLGDVMASAYPDRSIEGLYDYTAPDGSQHEFVLTGLALLGATRPGVESLQSLQDVARLYDIAAAGKVGGTAIEISVAASTDPSADEAEVNKEKEGIMPTLNEGLVQKLGISADADDETILAALDEALAERAGDTPAAETPEEVSTPEPVAASTRIEGVVQLDQTQYDDLVAAAADGRTARAQQIREEDERTVAAAIGAGKIPPARKQHWLEALDADRDGTKQVLASLKPGLIPLAEVGHGVTSEITNEDDALYASLFGKEA